MVVVTALKMFVLIVCIIIHYPGKAQL